MIPSESFALTGRSQGPPLKKGRAVTATRGHERLGATTLLAAMNVLNSAAVSRNMKHPRHQDFTRLLTAVEKQVPAKKPIHPVVDDKYPNATVIVEI